MSAGSTTSYTYDAENRMTAVSGAASATFVYDGDGRDLCTPERSERGNRVKGVVGGVTTTYIGDYFEWSPSGKPSLRVQAGSTSTMKKYYYAGGTRVAERKGTTLYWLLSDHQPLQGAPRGSTSITATSSGSKTAELRYKPCPLRGCSAALREGETRYTYGTTQTTIRYTPSGKTTLRVQAGQREESSLGLYWYASRWYSASLGRFLSADTIIPQPGNPQAWDRYSYTYNNPIRFTDPSGHVACDGEFSGGDYCDSTGIGRKINNTQSIKAKTTDLTDGPYWKAASTPEPTDGPYWKAAETPQFGSPIITETPPIYYPEISISVDWNRVDKIDLAIDGFGLIAEGVAIAALAVGAAPVSIVAESAGGIVEVIGFGKSAVELANGDPSDLLLQQAAKQADKTLILAARLGRTIPVFGIIGNIYSLAININPQINIEWKEK